MNVIKYIYLGSEGMTMGIEVIKYLMDLLDLIELYWGNLMFVSEWS